MVKYIRKALSVQWGTVFSLLNDMHKESGRSRIDLLHDMVKCYTEQGYTWENYSSFGFHLNKDKEIRNTFLSQGRMDELLYVLHTPESLETLADKAKTLSHFAEFIRRDWLDLRHTNESTFADFANRHEFIFAKPPKACGGEGINRYVCAEYPDKRALYNKLMELKQYVVEEAIQQHPEMSKLSVNAVNTLRIGTCVDAEGNTTIPYTCIRISINENFFDNACAGGASASLDEEGCIIAAPITHQPGLISFAANPITGFKYVGFKVPYFAEAKQLCLDAAKLLPEARNIGWDIAITPNGPDIVEANNNPGPDLYQNYTQLKDGKGFKQKMSQALGMEL